MEQLAVQWQVVTLVLGALVAVSAVWLYADHLRPVRPGRK